MSHKPIALKNLGSTCYLNSGIQAISSCPHFMKDFHELLSKYKGLTKLQFFNELMEIMSGTSSCENISSNNIFKEWTKPGQQDSFELLSHVINQVYDEIRNHKETNGEISVRNISQWLQVELPLRMKMEYTIKCVCGNIVKSPLQSDIALHLAFQNRTGTDGGNYQIQSMLDNYFDEDGIEDYECAKSGCTQRKAGRTLRLQAPLPGTICIHLQRLFWNGWKMEKIDDNVLFCNRITMRGTFMKSNKDDEVEKDTNYYLRSVIVHYGGESCGHYICYKKCDNGWFYTSDTSIHEESTDRVFCSNPYILFYEKSDVEEVSPRIFKGDVNLNLVLHAISSCPSFVSQLKSTEVLTNLILFINGCTTLNNTLANSAARPWGHPKDVFDTMKTVLSQISTDVSQRAMSTDDVPIKCSFCNGPVCQVPSMGVLELPVTVDDIDKRGMCSVQLLLDDHLEKDGLVGPFYWAEMCRGNESLKRTSLELHLPATILINIYHHDEWRQCNNKVKLDDNVFIRGRYCNEESDKKYYLKSIIGYGHCLRNVHGSWYRVDSWDVEKVDDPQYFQYNPSMLLYDTSSDGSCNDTLKNAQKIYADASLSNSSVSNGNNKTHLPVSSNNKKSATQNTDDNISPMDTSVSNNNDKTHSNSSSNNTKHSTSNVSQMDVSVAKKDKPNSFTSPNNNELVAQNTSLIDSTISNNNDKTHSPLSFNDQKSVTSNTDGNVSPMNISVSNNNDKTHSNSSSNNTKHSTSNISQMDIPVSMDVDAQYIITPSIMTDITKYLNSFVHAILSCSHFVNSLSGMDHESGTFLYNFLHLIRLSNESVMDDREMSVYTEGLQKQGVTDVYGVMCVILRTIMDNIGENIDDNLIKCRRARTVSCHCGYLSLHSPETDWTLNVTAKDIKSTLQESVDHLLRSEFVNGRLCDDCEDCHYEYGFMKCTLRAPLPRTMIVRVAPSSSNFTYSKFVLIKRKNCVQSDDKSRLDYDVLYELKSVIYDDGLRCYKKKDNRWYKISDGQSLGVTYKLVCKIRPCLLFYELYTLSDVHLRRVVQCLSSCSIFVDWLNTVRNMDGITDSVFLSNVVNVMDDSNKEIGQYWEEVNDVDIYVLLKRVIQDVDDKLRVRSLTDTVTWHSPMKTVIQHVVKDTSGRERYSCTKYKCILNVNVPDISESCTVQQLLDRYFEEQRLDLIGSQRYTYCQGNVRQYIVQGPLPRIICVRLKRFCGEGGSMRTSFGRVTVSQRITMTMNGGTWSRDSGGSSRSMKYRLRSVIYGVVDSCGEKYVCYTDIGDGYTTVGDAGMSPYIVFYEFESSVAASTVSRDCTQEQYRYTDTRSSQSMSTSGTNVTIPRDCTQEQYRYTDIRSSQSMSTSGTNVTLYVQKTSPKTRIDVNKNVILFNCLLSTGTCTEFVRNLRNEYSESAICTHLLDAVEMVRMSTDGTVECGDNADFVSWIDKYYYNDMEPFTWILDKLLNDVRAGCSYKDDKVSLPILILNIGRYRVTSSCCPVNIDVAVYQTSPMTLRCWVDTHLKLCNNGLYLDSDCKRDSLIYKRPPRTICFNIPDNCFSARRISLSTDFTVRNVQCQRTIDRVCPYYGTCCRKYSLKSVIDIDRHCYKYHDDLLYPCHGSVSSVSIDTVIARIIFYE